MKNRYAPVDSWVFFSAALNPHAPAASSPLPSLSRVLPFPPKAERRRHSSEPYSFVPYPSAPYSSYGHADGGREIVRRRGGGGG